MNDFIIRIKNFGLSEKNILAPLLRWGLGFWDYSVWGGVEISALEEKLFKVLFPNEIYDYNEFCKSKDYADKLIHTKWRNKLCDTQIIWCHINYGNDIFVTKNTSEFHAEYKKQELIMLGAKNIMYPDEAVNFLKTL